jgi:hypothetical protein
MRRAIAFLFLLRGADPNLAKTFIGGALLKLISVAREPHHVTRNDEFSLLGRAAVFGSPVRVQEGDVKA